MRMIRYLSMLLVLLSSITAWGQNTDDFDPAGPPEPGEPVLPDHPDEPDTYTLTLMATEGGSVKSGSGKYVAGTEVTVQANAAATNFVFIGWTDEQGETVATTLSFNYVMPERDVTLTANYEFEPGSPSEPSEPDIDPGDDPEKNPKYILTLVAEEGGSITAGAGEYEENEVVTVTASAAATNFVFLNWTDLAGEVVSEQLSFEYTMPAHDVTLTAHYDFVPGSPSEPSEPDIPDPGPGPLPTHTLTIVVEEGGSVTVNGAGVNGTREFTLEEGSEATIATTLSTNFTFNGWYAGDTLYSAVKDFTFTMDSVDVRLTARFDFDPNAPSEPSVPETQNNELYLMSVVGLPGETINYPLYLNSNDTLLDIRFEMQFPVMMKPDFDNVSISPNAVGYTFSYDVLDPSILGVQHRNEGILDDDYAIYNINLTGGVTPPGNTALLIVPVTIDEDIDRDRHRIWLGQVEVMLSDSTVVAATTRNGAINTDYQEPDSYSYLDNLISVGSATYSTTQAQQISHLEPFTVTVPADSISHILGCSDVSFMTFKGLESYRKVTDEQTAENGFWYGKDDYVHVYVEDPGVMGMAVQYDPETHVMSVMQYPGAYEVGDADTVKVYFTYKYKYFEVELRLQIDRADILIELNDELSVLKDSLAAARERITACYTKTSANDINALGTRCDSYSDQTSAYIGMIATLQEGEDFNAQEIHNEIRTFITEAKSFIVEADSVMPLYEKAFGDLQEAKASLVSTMAELAESATASSLEEGQALVAKVDEEYTGYDVAKAEEMTDSLKAAETLIRNSVGYDDAVEKLSELRQRLEIEQAKIAECLTWTNASEIHDLDDRCTEELLKLNELESKLREVIDLGEALTDDVMEALDVLSYSVDLFIADADNTIEAFAAAYESLQQKLASLDAAIEDVLGKVPSNLIAEATELHKRIADEQPSYSLPEYENAEGEIVAMINRLHDAIQTEDVTITIVTPGTLDDEIANPEDVERLVLIGPLNGTDIKFVRESLPKLRELDMQQAWIVSGGEAYLDGMHTADLSIGERMFSDMPTLTDIILTDSIQSIGSGILDGTENVSVIAIPAMTSTVAAGALDGTRMDIKVEWNSTEAIVPALLNGNPNLIVYAVDGVRAEKDWQNIVRNGRIENILLRDDYAFCIPEAFMANKAQYSRKFTKEAGPGSAGGWESIVLPFDVTSIEHRNTGRTLLPFGNTESCDARFWLARLETGGFTATATMEANVPYVIRMPNSDEYDDDLNVTGVVVFSAESSNGFEMHATAEAIPSQSAEYEIVPSFDFVEADDFTYILNSEQYDGYLPGSVFVRGEGRIKPFESYVRMLSNVASAPMMIPVGGADTDGILELKADIHSGTTIYDLHGRRVDESSMRSGNIYIINGKKVVTVNN